MDSIESVSHGSLVACTCKGREYSARDVMEAALFWGTLAEYWESFLQGIAAESRAEELGLELDEDALGAEAEAFRYQHDLITAEETEHWLAARGLTLDDFSDFFARQIWNGMKVEDAQSLEIDYLSAPVDLQETFTVDLILAGQLDQITVQLSWRLAALCSGDKVEPEFIAAEKRRFLERNKMEATELSDWLKRVRRGEEWLNQLLEMEAAFRKRTGTLLTPQAYQREMALLRLPLTQLETEVIELESRDAAQEALFCVREDGMSMEEVASDGRYPYRRLDFVLEDLSDDMQQKFLSVSPAQVLEPIPRGEGFELWSVINKTEPRADDPEIRSRIERRLLHRHFSELADKHVRLRLAPITASE